ncbi:MAG TPA: O-methyltransferase [Candidatus Atribacteria bacterium]|nr:O-methyltransferase [Candidatus Atribacteria bacterium]HPT77866.1 O-methyltransferase [Candidatus Atribacteria bacterium]
MDIINRSYIDEYLKEMATYPCSDVMKAMRRTAEREGIPVLRPAAASFLNVLVRAVKPLTALEIGTSIGFSSLLILSSMPKEGRLVTVDSDEDRIEQARCNFAAEGVLDRITLINKDAGEVLHYLSDTFDFIFLDGPKAQYINYLPDCVRLLSAGGMLVCDDVLFYGMVADNALVKRRKITIVKRMRKFLSALMTQPGLHTTIVPIGDGMSVSIKEADR